MEENKKLNSKGGGIIERVWRFFSSIKLAFILIIAIALLSLLGALIMQYTGEPESYQSWLENAAQPKYGLWTPIMAILQLFRVFHSIWFLGAAAFLVINILVCSLNRWKKIMQLIRGGQIMQAGSYYQASGGGIELSRKNDSPEAALEPIIDGLRSRGYRVRKEISGGTIHIASDKNRHFKLATYLTHFSLVLFILGFLVSSALGFRNDHFSVGVGGVENVGDNSALSLKLVSFKDEYYPNGSPKDFRSEVVLFDRGIEVEKATIQVNHPLSYRGYRFFQSFFGPAVIVQIKDNTGQPVFNGSIQLTQPLQVEGLDLISGSIVLPQSGFNVRAIKAKQGGGGSMIKEDDLVIQIIDHSTQQVLNMASVAQGEPAVLNNLEFSYLGDTQYSGFQVTRDPGANFIWAASILLLAGLVLVFYFPLRQLWAVAIPAGPRASRVSLRAANASSDLDRLVKKIESYGVKNKK